MVNKLSDSSQAAYWEEKHVLEFQSSYCRRPELWTVRCLNGTYAVVSCPPPWDAVLKKIPAGLPASCWVPHSPPVASKNALNCAAIIPNLVGKPKRTPSASVRSLGLMIGTSLFGGAPIFPRTSSGRVSGTCDQYAKNIRGTLVLDTLKYKLPFLEQHCKNLRNLWCNYQNFYDLWMNQIQLRF